MKRTTVYLTDRQKEALARLSRASGRSEADLIREGVELLTALNRAPKPVLPLFDSGQPELSERLDAPLGGFGER